VFGTRAQLGLEGRQRQSTSSRRAAVNEALEAGGAPEQPLFYPVGLRKFALMHAVTFGLYELHWFYENWWLIKARRNARFNPAGRTFMAPVFVWSLFREIRRAADEERIPTAFSPLGAAVLYLVGVLATFALIDDLWPVGLLLLYVPLHAAQHLASRVNAARAPHADRNETYSLANKATLLVGGVLFLLGLWSSFEGVKERYENGSDNGAADVRASRPLVPDGAGREESP
jgi:hypothetical protein